MFGTTSSGSDVLTGTCFYIYIYFIVLNVMCQSKQTEKEMNRPGERSSFAVIADELIKGKFRKGAEHLSFSDPCSTRTFSCPWS